MKGPIIAEELLNRYFEGRVTDKERELVDYWFHYYRLDSSSEFSFDELIEAKTSAWSNITPVKGVRFFTLSKVAAAVAAIFLVALGVTWYSRINKADHKENTALLTNHIIPGKNAAVLKLADGKMITLDSAKKGLLAIENGINVSKNGDGQLIYSNDRTMARRELFNEVETPRGGQYAVKLADGSMVYLNAASRLRFPVVFTGKKRVVFLDEGEAYFEVSHDADKAFEVVSKTQVIQVLGTHFNVKNYRDDEAVLTTLLQGSVQIKSGARKEMLRPGQQSVNEGGMLKVQSVNAENAVAWQRGLFRFKDENIYSVMRTLSRWYDVEVKFEDPISGEKFSGQLSKYKNIGLVLQMLERTKVVHFKIEGRRVIVTK